MTGDDSMRAGARGPDLVAGQIRQWLAIHPDLDTSGMAVIGRINRAAVLLQQVEDASLVEAGVSRPEFVTLAALRRTGRPITPGQLARETSSSGAAVTKRIRAMEQRGLLRRRSDDRDRRIAWVSLSEEGRSLIDLLLPEQTGYESELLSGLGPERIAELSALLGDLLAHLEGALPNRSL